MKKSFQLFFFFCAVLIVPGMYSQALAVVPAIPTLSSPAANANVVGSSVNLSWSASTGATQYWLWARRTSDNVVIFNQNVGNLTSYTLTGLPNNGSDYFWMVRAGNSGGWSKWTAARRFYNGTAAIPAIPTLSSPVANANVAGTSVNLSWSASTGATQYWLWARRTSDKVVIFNQNIGNRTSYTLTGLPNNGSDYFWMVRAGNNGGWSKWTAARRFFNGTAAIPAIPALSSPAANANVAGPSVNLSWSASSGATQYWLWVKRASDNVVIFNQSVGNTTSRSLTGLPNNGGAYFWMVRAYNSGGWSGWPVARRFFIRGASCTYSISSSSGSFTSSGGTSTVLVSTSNTSCAWIAYESLSWVSLSKTGGTGNGTVTVIVSANIGAARSGSITIAGKTYTISQAAPGHGYEGTWEGEMYPGVSISFEVEESGGAYYVKKATGTFYVSECNKHISWDSGDILSVIISNNQCSMYFPDIQMELNITFDSKTESHGTWKSNETLCPGISIDGTFRAMRFVDDTAKQTIPVGRSPQSITISSDGAYVYVSNVGDNTLSVIQTSDNTVIDTISVGEKPGDIAVTPNGNFVYVTSPSSDSVSVIRTADNKVIDEISVVDPKALAVSLNGEYLYVTSCGDYVTRHEYSKSTVTVIRTVDNSIVDEISVGDSPSQIALSPDGKYLYVTNSGSGGATGAQQPSISVVQTSDNFIKDTITSLLLDSNDLFKDIVVTPNGKYVYVLDGMPQVIRTSDNKHIGWATLQGPVRGIDVSPNGEYLYLLIGSSWAEPNITALYTSTHNDAFKITLNSIPLDIAVSPNGKCLYVTSGGGVTFVKL